MQFKNYFNENLAGVLNNNKTGPMVLFVHGFGGNKNESKNLFLQASEYFSKKDINTFRFDMSGVGESEGDFLESTLKKQSSDLNATLEFITDTYNPKKIGVVGFSLGATISLLSLNPHIESYSLWSPAFFPSKDMFPRYDTPEIKKELKIKGFIEKKELKVSKKMLEDLKNCNLISILSIIQKPIQIIHGSKDQRINYQSSVLASRYLTNGHEIKIIQGANHSYKNRLEYRQEVFEKSASWFKKTLK